MHRGFGFGVLLSCLLCACGASDDGQDLEEAQAGSAGIATAGTTSQAKGGASATGGTSGKAGSTSSAGMSSTTGGSDDGTGGSEPSGTGGSSDAGKGGSAGNAASAGSGGTSSQGGASGSASGSAGGSALPCPQLSDDCNDDPRDGCETPLYTKDNCGECGAVCRGSTQCKNVSTDPKKPSMTCTFD